ncbi:glycosyltransferase [Clostridium perfringens]|uniref:Capsular polysaccharide biosynthsis protein n=2 Tax=Clostridium perfringens TaxID=1502 RepID=B1BNI0_CLOPF|nr:glycosyltransferase [Clostridium perfringens]EDT16701.1 capsular polysaccharide biosynthsis protein [Clostridium perfringens E str. JGS1987]EJT6558959.1 glycosyltransferase [Clostridium perfringens]EJT6560093.1 glycosyltransferase [Clostridium perfringens]ELC8459837.1 glycosyltransferase [Clostridium perfringens]ELC8460950.1 glycosyltransferase [Clostridium perfringens]
MKRILFVIDSLNCAGAEKSLISLLNLIDYSKYNVDLQLFGYGGVLESLLPKDVNLLSPLDYTKFSSENLKNLFTEIKDVKTMRMLIARLKFSTNIRIKKSDNIEKTRIFWGFIGRFIEENSNYYDIAISYSQGIPTFYVAEKINANKKIAWVNTDYRLNSKEKTFQERYYNLYKNIIIVSDSSKEIFLETFPKYKEKTKVIYDINNYDFIKKMSLVNEEYIEKLNQFKGIKIITLARLTEEKRLDRVLNAAKRLKETNIDFKWLILGEGKLENKLKLEIKKKNLKENIILLGLKVNPYPYIKACDIYVQTSDLEGFGLAIAEARMLNKPVVTTRFDAVFNQMIHEKNGLVVDMNSDAVFNGIMRLINDENLRKNIIKYLENEKKGNVEEIDKFYKLIES